MAFGFTPQTNIAGGLSKYLLDIDAQNRATARQDRLLANQQEQQQISNQIALDRLGLQQQQAERDIAEKQAIDQANRAGLNMYASNLVPNRLNPQIENLISSKPWEALTTEERKAVEDYNVATQELGSTFNRLYGDLLDPSADPGVSLKLLQDAETNRLNTLTKLLPTTDKKSTSNTLKPKALTSDNINLIGKQNVPAITQAATRLGMDANLLAQSMVDQTKSNPGWLDRLLGDTDKLTTDQVMQVATQLTPQQGTTLQGNTSGLDRLALFNSLDPLGDSLQRIRNISVSRPTDGTGRVTTNGNTPTTTVSTTTTPRNTTQDRIRTNTQNVKEFFKEKQRILDTPNITGRERQRLLNELAESSPINNMNFLERVSTEANIALSEKGTTLSPLAITSPVRSYMVDTVNEYIASPLGTQLRLLSNNARKEGKTQEFTKQMSDLIKPLADKLKIPESRIIKQIKPYSNLSDDELVYGIFDPNSPLGRLLQSTQ